MSDLIPETILILTVLGAVFVAGASVGQLLLRVKLAKMERENLELEKKRMADLRRTIKARAIFIERKGPNRLDQAVRDEIDEILGDIENP